MLINNTKEIRDADARDGRITCDWHNIMANTFLVENFGYICFYKDCGGQVC